MSVSSFMQKRTKKQLKSNKLEIFYSDDDNYQKPGMHHQPKHQENPSNDIQSEGAFQSKTRKLIRKSSKRKEKIQRKHDSMVDEEYSSISDDCKSQDNDSLSNFVSSITDQPKVPKQKKKAIEGEKSSVLRSRSNNRKTRTSVSEQKVKMMQHLFPYAQNGLRYKGNILNLKDISKIVNLGYSTILHKYKNFRRKGNVQKGLLLKCKDFKRKYNKSLQMQQYIKQSLKQSKFRTAKQLAQYIKQKYKVNSNRSIISRHLNQMQRDKFQFFGEKKYVNQVKMDNQEQMTGNALRKFRQVYFALKSHNHNFYYINAIRLYYFQGNVTMDMDQYVGQNYQLINLIITSTETSLISYYPEIADGSDNLFRPSHSDHRGMDITYESLYRQIEQKWSQIPLYNESSMDQIYFIFAYDNSRREQQIRGRVNAQLLKQKVNLLVMPPSIVNLNFINNWFQKQVLTKVQSYTYESVQSFGNSLLSIMNQKQVLLEDYSVEMTSNIQKM